uniref:Uncharacterized protein n=1 Tax=Hyaloperonospora arabidopsidis (strain Emoy2) TaxID=559515 RepID=M4BV70_HYAAE
MEKDLQDAYAALQLLHADLALSRRDNGLLKAPPTHLPSHGLSSRTPHIDERHGGILRMFSEDTKSRSRSVTMQSEDPFAERARGRVCTKCEPTETNSLELDDYQVIEPNELEKSALLTKLQSLTSTVEQQMQTMLAQQASFALQREELETMLEETVHKLQVEKRKVADAVLEQQTVKEKYEFLETQVEILLRDREKLRQQHVRTIGELREDCAKLQARLAISEAERAAEAKEFNQIYEEREKHHVLSIGNLETKLKDAYRQVAASESARATEKKEHERKLEMALKSVRAQQPGGDEHVTPRQGLDKELVTLEAQLGVSKEKFDEEAMQHDEKLRSVSDQQHYRERYEMNLHGFESYLLQNQLHLACTDTEHHVLSNGRNNERVKAVQIAGHCKTPVRPAVLGKKIHQQEIRTAQHADGLAGEECFDCQSSIK